MYGARMRLAKLGFHQSLEELDVMDGEAMMLIDSTIDELRAEEYKKAEAKRKGLKRGTR